MKKDFIRNILPFALVCSALVGCAYKGGKIIDGTNIEIGLSVPGAEGWTINALSYTAGLRVCGNDDTSITVWHETAETNSYFGIVHTQRTSKMTARIEPVEYDPSTTNIVETAAE